MNSEIKYYELYIDVYIIEQWHLKRPMNSRGEWVIPWTLCQGRPVHLEEEPVVPLSRPGLALDYSDTMGGISVLSQRLVNLWHRLGLEEEIQLIPVRVEGQTEHYYLLNTLRVIRCVDETRSDEFAFYEPQDGEPEKVGHYRKVSGMKIDPTRVGDAEIFRPWGWTVTLIVSERVKRAMEEEGIRGARFIEV